MFVGFYYAPLLAVFHGNTYITPPFLIVAQTFIYSAPSTNFAAQEESHVGEFYVKNLATLNISGLLCVQK